MKTGSARWLAVAFFLRVRKQRSEHITHGRNDHRHHTDTFMPRDVPNSRRARRHLEWIRHEQGRRADVEIKWWLETHGGHGVRLSRNQVFHLLQPLS